MLRSRANVQNMYITHFPLKTVLIFFVLSEATVPRHDSDSDKQLRVILAAILGSTTTVALTVTNHNRFKQFNEAIKMQLYVTAAKRGKIRAGSRDWFWFSLIEKVARAFLANHKSQREIMQNQIKRN